MKKVAAIMFLLLYTLSFSGMVWAKDCETPTFSSNIEDADASFCNIADGHSSRAMGHPLQHVCKLIEVHKQVLVNTRHFSSVYTHNPTLSAVFLRPTTTGLLLPQAATEQLFYTHKLFIKNRFLLL